MIAELNRDDVLREAHRVLWAEACAIKAVAGRLGDDFQLAAEAMFVARIVHVVGIGKSGDIARKIANTLTSTGTPALFLHPVEALHGGIGIVAEDDVVIVISRSGECQELLVFTDQLRRLFAGPVIALTGATSSRLGQAADIAIDCAADEACPLGLAPTSSTAAALAMGDALAMVLMSARGFDADDFRATHPGGSLGEVPAHDT